MDAIEDYAVLAAQLANPFADRLAVLADHGLDESAYNLLRERCRSELACAEQAARYARAYSAARRRAKPQPDPVEAWRQEAALVQLNVEGEAPPLLCPAADGTEDTLELYDARMEPSCVDDEDEITLMKAHASSEAERTIELGPYLAQRPVMPFRR